MLLKNDRDGRIEIEMHGQESRPMMLHELLGATAMLERPAKIALFGPFELNLETGELLKAGIRVRLQNKPFQILRALIQQRGEVVTRDELRHHVWPDDTFVDFESGLNTAANRLRLALNDSAEHPVYVETLPRIGYRFIASVQFQAHPGALDQPLVPQPSADVQPPRRKLLSLALVAGATAAVLITGPLFWRRHPKAAVAPAFHQLTFRKGGIDNARFTPQGEIVFSATWDGEPNNLYIMSPTSPEARQLPFGPVSLVSVSSSSEVSFLRKVTSGGDALWELAVAPLYGGTARVVTRDVRSADVGPHGEICVIRRNSRGFAVESPPGKVVYQTSAWLSSPRLSPDGSLVAVSEHPLQDDDSGDVLLVSRDGKVRRLSEGWASLGAVAWSTRGDEVWFSAAKHGINREIYAVDLRQRLRRVAGIPAVLDLFDIAPSGTVLIGRSTPRLSMLVGDVKSLTTKDFSWLDWSRIVAMSADGNELLFDETGEGGGPAYSVYLRRRDRGTTERIGDGHALDLSQDGAWILTAPREPSSTISLISAEDAQTTRISAPGFIYQSAYFLGQSRDILVQLSQISGSHGQRLYLQNIESGALRELKDASGMGHLIVSPTGTAVASYISESQFRLMRLPSAEESIIQTTETAIPVAWINENTVVVASPSGDRLHLDELDVNSGKRKPLLQLPPQVLPEMKHMPVLLSADLRTFAFSWLDHGENLFTAQGWS